jgi:hypothetical protein
LAPLLRRASTQDCASRSFAPSSSRMGTPWRGSSETKHASAAFSHTSKGPTCRAPSLHERHE